MKKQTIWVLLHLLLLPLATNAQLIRWHAKQMSIRLMGQQVSILEDKMQDWTLEQVASDTFQARFTPYTQKILNTELKGSHCWVRFTIENPTEEHLILEIAQPLLDTVSLSFKDSTGLWQTIQNGFSKPLYQKELKHPYHLFHLPAGKTTLYFRFQDQGFPVPMSIWHEKAYEVKDIRQKLVQGIYIGVILFVVLNNIFWFFSLGWISNLQYAFLVFSYACFSSIYEGYICYFFPQLDLIKWYFFNTSLNIVTGVLYALFFLETKKYLPRMYHFGMAYLGYYLFFFVFRFCLPIHVAVILDHLHGLFTILFLSYLGFKSYQKGNQLGQYYGATYILFFFIALIEVVYDRTGAPAYFFDLSYISIGILVEVFSLAYLLSKRLEWENTAKEAAKQQAQLQLLVQTKENERILEYQNEFLEKQVNERTAELQNSLGIIQEQSDKLTILMKELHHRVKNNLQIVSSLLNIQSYGLKDAEAVKALQESKHRVDAMSLIHQHLYQTDDTGYLDIQAYTTNICESLMRAYGYSYQNFDLKVEVPQLYFDIDQAIPIGLILNELVTNSFKYAYENVDEPALSVVLIPEIPYTLHIMDNGNTFTKTDWERKTVSFGKQLILSLTHQINGKLSLNTESGTHFKIILYNR